MKKHTPVLVREVLSGLSVHKGGKYIDATFGFGGHSKEIKRLGGVILGIDVDLDTDAVHGNFRDIERIAKENGFEKVDGILFDLGVSSHQLDTPQRGFSYRYDGPLDLRFDKRQRLTARDIINTSSEEELYEIFARFGEEQLAGTIARALVRARRMKPITTTRELVDVVARHVGDARKLPAVLSRVFQALRILVNDELGSLKEGLEGGEELLKPGGRLAVISYHSLEDRVVKQAMQKAVWRIVTKHPIIPAEEEVTKNPRARSAKLRVAEKV